MAEKGGFSSISDLLTTSWQIITQCWSKLLILSLIGAAVIIAYSILVGIVVAGAGIGGAALGAGYALAGTMGLIALISALAYIGIFAVFGTAMIKIVSGADKDKGTMEYVKEGFGMFWPIFLVTMITAVLTIGGFGLFIIPGLAIAILLSFAIYEVALHKTGVSQALRNSAAIVSQNFGAIVIRWLVALGVSLLISFVFSRIGDEPLVMLIAYLIQILLSWFFIAYWYQVYKQARSATDLKAASAITWMYVVAAVGWLLIVGISMVAGQALNKLFSNPEFMREFNSASGLNLETDSDGTEGMLEDYSDLYDGNTNTQDSDDEMGVDAFDSMIQNSDMTPEEQEQARKAMEEFFKALQENQDGAANSTGNDM